MGDLERRSTERRNDPNIWSDQHRKQVQLVYAMVVGGIIVVFGLTILAWAVMQAGETNKTALIVGGSICLVGLVASMPRTFMPILSYVLKRIPFLKNGEPSKNEIAAVANVIDLVPLSEMEDGDE